MNRVLAGPSRKSHARATERVVKAAAPRERVERSESLDDAEASARINGMMAGLTADVRRLSQRSLQMLVKWRFAANLRSRTTNSQQR